MTTVKKKLVVVESPSKAKTLGQFLGKDYSVLASYGHVMDLPKSKMGVDTEHNYKVDYIVPEKAEKHVKELKMASKGATDIYLATDPDREGEAISWHIAQILGKNHKFRRVTFHEITKAAVAESFDNPGELNLNLVDAQQARRVLDRLVGYKLSPLLWKKVLFGLSAGRVQSVAVRLIVERERERQAFKPEEYWSVEVDLSSVETPFLASNSDRKDVFTAALSEINGKKAKVASKYESTKIVADLETASYQISKVTQTDKKRNPNPPFTTASLQQNAGNTFSMTAKRTMDAAQKLFEAGLITYHRTDSLNLSPQFVTSAREFIAREFGQNYVPAKPNFYATKSKNAQEAHEAIRPTDVTARKVSLSGAVSADAEKVYQLIWQRAVRSQMVPAIYEQVSVDVTANSEGPSDNSMHVHHFVNSRYLLRSSGSVLKFDGCLRAGFFKTDAEAEGVAENVLKNLKVDRTVYLQPPVRPNQHFTEPPARYTESTLIKALEEYGIGRPSTYAPTINTVQTRGYVAKEGRALYPKDVAFVVNDLLVKHFPSIVDYQFTAQMEDQLDEVARGEKQWVPVVKDFYEPFEKILAIKDKELKKSDYVNLGSSDKTCPECGSPLIYKLGRYGKFLSCSNWPKCKYAEVGGQMSDVGNQNSDLLSPTSDLASSDPGILDQLSGGCPICKSKLTIKTGPFGKFIACENYPKCKFTKPVLHKIGLNCPKCGEGEVVKKFTKRKRLFFGCSRYPACDFASWTDPRVEVTTAVKKGAPRKTPRTPV